MILELKASQADEARAEGGCKRYDTSLWHRLKVYPESRGAGTRGHGGVACRGGKVSSLH